MSSTPGRHLEITQVTDGRGKPQGKVLMRAIKGAAITHSSCFGKNGKQHEDHAQMNSTKLLTSTGSHQA